MRVRVRRERRGKYPTCALPSVFQSALLLGAATSSTSSAAGLSTRTPRVPSKRVLKNGSRMHTAVPSLNAVSMVASIFTTSPPQRANPGQL